MMAQTKNRGRRSSSARRSDKYDLYQRSVQEPSADVRFFRRIFRKEYCYEPRLLREDFCGTGYLCCTWARQHRENHAIGVDLDPEPLAWGAVNNSSGLRPDERQRVTLREGNALEIQGRKVDIVAALNFSYFIFKRRAELLRYFRAARRNLKAKGLFVLDIQGGPEAQLVQEEERDVDGFTYIWDQHSFDPISYRAMCYIHFRFPDGSLMKRAFSYEWRVWSLPEIREVLLEAGFQRADVYWEGTDHETEEGNGVFTRRERAENSEAWIAYVVGVK
ncbi:MAG: class I SAM-dependent methyltransferase [Planctomycetota bacterium]